MDLSKGVCKHCVMVDFHGFSLFNQPPFSVSKQVLQLLMDRFPERMGVFFVIDPPALFWVFYKVMKVFASQATLDKVKFVTSKGKACTAGATGRMHPELAKNFDADQLEEDYGGTLTSNWDAKAYFEEEDRQAALLMQWVHPEVPAAARNGVTPDE